jgi:hypothetical protein
LKEKDGAKFNAIHNPKVGGSIPPVATKFLSNLQRSATPIKNPVCHFCALSDEALAKSDAKIILASISALPAREERSLMLSRD